MLEPDPLSELLAEIQQEIAALTDAEIAEAEAKLPLPAPTDHPIKPCPSHIRRLVAYERKLYKTLRETGEAGVLFGLEPQPGSKYTFADLNEILAKAQVARALLFRALGKDPDIRSYACKDIVRPWAVVDTTATGLTSPLGTVQDILDNDERPPRSRFN